jgi:hypothetical protein
MSTSQPSLNFKCKKCCSDRPKRFTSEIALRFPGIEGLNKPIVLVFPETLVCLECGVAEFAVPEKELEVLRTETLVEGATAMARGGS